MRYVDSIGAIKERLVSVVKCEQSTGEAFVQVIRQVLSEMKLDIKNCIGNSTDGASNMQGRYKGFSILLSKEVPMQIHIWCHALVLNLVVTEAKSAVVTSTSLFSLLNDIAVFFRESYQRMNIWNQHSTGDKKAKRLGTIEETRWWSKDAALKKVLASFNDLSECLFLSMLNVINFTMFNVICISQKNVQEKVD